MATLNPTLAHSRTMRRWATFVVAFLIAAGLIAFAQFWQGIDDSFRSGITNLAIFAALLVFALWFLAFGGWRWYTRLGIVVASYVVLVGGLYALFGYVIEIRGVTGDWVPTFAWRWTARPDYALNAEPPPEESGPATVAAPAPTDFPAFLGADGSNHLKGIGLDPDWEKHPPREVWRRTGAKKLGPAWSAFAVVGSRAVTQEQRGDWELVTCYNLDDGALLWSHRDKSRFSDFQGGDGPRATPTIVGDRVFTMGARGILNCLQLESGKPLWPAVNVLEDNDQPDKLPVWAKSNSPLVFDQPTADGVRQLVVVTLGEDMKNPKALHLLAAYDGATGKRVWSAGEDRTAYATPILTTLAGVRQIVSVNGTSVTGHDPATGAVLWSYPWDNSWAKCSQPVPVGDDRLFVSEGYHVGAKLLKVEHADDKWNITPLWQNQEMRTTYSNVVVDKDHVYGLDDGVLECIDLKTGAKKWRAGRYRYGQVLGVDGYLIVQAEGGKVFLVAADPEKHRELGELDALHEKTWNNPVLVGKYLLLRNAEEAVCYELPLKK